MAYGAIQKISTDFESYGGYWLKGYEQGTTNPLAMATSAAATTLLAKAEVSSGGVVPIGFIKTAGDVIFQPYFNEAYDLWLFPTEAEADANDTTNAIQVADNASPFPSQSTVTNYTELDALLSADHADGAAVEVTGSGIAGTFVARTGAHTDNGGTIRTFGDAAGRYWDRIWDNVTLLVDWFSAVGDGVSDDLTPIQSAQDFAESIGADVAFSADKTYGISSSINVGVDGRETYLIGGSKNGATIKALSAFTGGLVIITQGGVDGMQFEGFDNSVIGHVAIFLGTALATNPLCRVENVLNTGGFYEFISTVYEYDNAILSRIVSNVDVGNAAVNLVTGGSFAFAASPRINLSLRNPKSTPIAGDTPRFGLIIGRSESARVTGLVSNFDNNIQIGGASGIANREIELDNLLCLDLRSTPSNELWEDDWAATTAYSLGVYRRPTAVSVNGHFYIVTSSGTSGGVEPIWPTVVGSTVIDGTVIWTEVGESVNAKIGVNQQNQISNCRFEDAIIALYHTSLCNTSLKSSRLVGESTAFAHDSANQSELLSTNSLIVGDIKLSGGSGFCKFHGTHNTIISDTFLDVPDHKALSVSTGSHIYIDSGSGPTFSSLDALTGSTSRTIENYDHGVNWGSSPLAGVNTANPSMTTERYTVNGNTVFCDIDGTVDITFANLNTAFSLTVPVAMVSNGNPCVSGTISLTTGNGDIAVCTVDNNSGGNNTSVRVSIPKKMIAIAGDQGVGLFFQGGFSYTKA